MGHASLEAQAGFGHRERTWSFAASGSTQERLGGLGKSRDLGLDEYWFTGLVAELSQGLSWPSAGLHQAGFSGVVCLASSHSGRPRSEEHTSELQSLRHL